MNIRIFALLLVASQIVASGAGAVERKSHHQPRVEDRNMYAKSDGYYRPADRTTWDQAPAGNLSDPPVSANGQ